MSLIQHTFFPRSSFDMDFWLRPETMLGSSTLDLFDPFDELDRVLGRNLQWLTLPNTLQNLRILPQPKVPRKYRIVVNCRGYSPQSIKTQVSEDKSRLLVSAQEGSPAAGEQEDYSLREFRRTYNLPSNLETEQLVSFMTSNGRLVIEIPIRGEEKKDQTPHEVTDESGKKAIEIKFTLPPGIEPANVKVSVKDRDVIVQAEETRKEENADSRVYYYRRSTLPENTDFSELKCNLENSQLSIKAPLQEGIQSLEREIPVQFERKEEKKALPQQQQSKEPQVQKQPVAGEKPVEAKQKEKGQEMEVQEQPERTKAEEWRQQETKKQEVEQ